MKHVSQKLAPLQQAEVRDSPGAELIRIESELAAARRECEDLAMALERSESRFRNIIERNADAIIVVDRGGIVRFVNDVAVGLLGRSRHDLVGSSFGFPLVTGETIELDLLRNAGQLLAEMRVVETEWDGEPACIASLRDVTERKRNEEGARRLIREQTARTAAEAAAHKFRFLAESTSLLTSSLDYANTLRALVTLCAQKLADWAVLFIIDEDGLPQRLEVAHRDPNAAAAARDLLAQPLDTERARPVMEVIRTRKPLLVREVTEQVSASLVHDEQHRELLNALGFSSLMLVPLVARDQSVGAIALVSSDSTRLFGEDDLDLAVELSLRAGLAVENARLYREAQDANQTKSDFLAVISHDLRTPLSSIIGYAELLTMGIPDTLSAVSGDWVSRIRKSASHLLYLIDELLAYARLDAGHEQLRLREVQVQELIVDVRAVIEPLAHSRDLAFVVDCDDSAGICLHTDTDKLRQVLLNLLGNAVKYTEKGSIELRVRVDNESAVEFVVRDSGVGISPDNIERIFEPFWQVHQGERTRAGGTGLGLSVVRRLASLLNGKVAVQSTPGLGSTFTLTLPATHHSAMHNP